MKIALFGVALLGAASPLVTNGKHLRPRLLEGVVQPSRVVHVGGAADGLLAEVLVEEGEVVDAGQVLARLDFRVQRAQTELARARTELAASLRAAEARLDLAVDRLRRREALLDEGIVTSDEVQTLRAEQRLAELQVLEVEEQLRIAELEYERDQAILEQATITSPVHGVVMERLLSPGELLSGSDAREIVTLAQLDPLFVDVDVPIEHWSDVRVGDDALVDLLNVDYVRVPARVRFVDRLIETASETFRVRLELPNPDLELPAGLRCHVAFKP